MLNEIIREKVEGQFTTVKEELAEMVEEIIEEMKLEDEYDVTLTGNSVIVDSDEEMIVLHIECAGRTWYFA